VLEDLLNDALEKFGMYSLWHDAFEGPEETESFVREHVAKLIHYGENGAAQYGYVAAIDPDLADSRIVGHFIDEYNMLHDTKFQSLQQIAEATESTAQRS